MNPLDTNQAQEDASTHSAAWLTHFKAQHDIGPGLGVPFDVFMDCALYDPKYGYYLQDKAIFGEAGDFTTSPEISPAFAFCIANQCAQVIKALPDCQLIELGGGSGTLCAHILKRLEQLDAVPECIWIIEISTTLQQRQQQTLQTHVPHLVDRVKWCHDIHDVPTCSAMVIANEVLDALPVRRFQKQGEHIRELGVQCIDDSLSWIALPEDEAFTETVRKIETSLGGPLPNGMCSEIRPAMAGLFEALCKTVTKGAMLFIDYGYPKSEYYHTYRMQGTLRAYFHHQAFDEPFMLPGCMDISAHVDFSALATHVYDQGWQVTGYTPQAFFLMATGIEQYMQDALTVSQYADNVAIKRLLMPDDMGSHFKVFGCTHGIENRLDGFALKNLVHQL